MLIQGSVASRTSTAKRRQRLARKIKRSRELGSSRETQAYHGRRRHALLAQHRARARRRHERGRPRRDEPHARRPADRFRPRLRDDAAAARRAPSFFSGPPAGQQPRAAAATTPRGFRGRSAPTFAVAAQAAGYATSLSGKYLNNYALAGSHDGCAHKNDARLLARAARLGRLARAPRQRDLLPRHDQREWAALGLGKERYLPDAFFNFTRAFIAAHDDSRPWLAVYAPPSCHSSSMQEAAYRRGATRARSPASATRGGCPTTMRRRAPSTG